MNRVWFILFRMDIKEALEPTITKQVDFETAYFTVRWSCLRKADKYDIATAVPSLSGIFELYFMDDRKKLNLFYFAKAYYGGLRNSIRLSTDEEEESDETRKKIIADHDIYYRYTLTDSYKDMCDVFFFFAQTYRPELADGESSGRFKNIFVKEISKDKIVTI
jgi:hypothetical protein